MSEQRADLSRRDFLKVAAGTTAAVVVASTGLDLAGAGDALGLRVPKAFADTTLADGDYTVNANLYIDKSIVLIHVNAYFTNPNNPNLNEGMPNTPNDTLNATLHVSGSTATVTVPLVNECFMLLSAEGNTDQGIEISSIQTKTGMYPDNNPLTRISEITFNLSNLNGTYTLGACKEYAAYENPPFPMSMLVPGYLEWTATLQVDFDTATAVSA